MEIDECSNAVALTVFPGGKEKQYGRCVGSPSANDICKYSLQLECGKLQ